MDKVTHFITQLILHLYSLHSDYILLIASEHAIIRNYVRRYIGNDEKYCARCHQLGIHMGDRAIKYGLYIYFFI